MQTYDVSQSQVMMQRAQKVIPGGIFGHYRYAVREGSPLFFSRAQGAHFWDIDDNEYIDLMCAYGPAILGYNHPGVDEAARTQYALGNTVSLAAPAMVELAETLVDMVSDMDWALFGKNGGDSTALAVMVARAATGREKIVKVNEGYHGVASWMQNGQPGTVASDGEHVLTIPWNDVEGFTRLIAEHPGKIACFISSPYDHPVLRDNELPAEGYWQKMEGLCRQHGIVLIVDDVRAGFRVNLAGSHVAYGFTPDLVCFGKAIANGYPLSALMGQGALKQAAHDVYFTGTQFFNAVPMAAATATLRELQTIDAANLMTDIGNRLNTKLVQTAGEQGFKLVASGIPAMPYYRLSNVNTEGHFTWIDECVKRGVYMLGYHNHFVSTEHSDADIERICEVATEAFRALGDIDQYRQQTA